MTAALSIVAPPLSIVTVENEPELQLEIAHILFIDIVGFSKLLNNQQHDSLQELNQIARNSDAFRSAEAAGKLMRLPTGDGMALVFLTAPDAPVRCAVQISKNLRAHSELKVRMGVHSGPVTGLTDVNDQSNVTGAGINIAQRVMDCGDAGHILLSQRVAEDLAQYSTWQPLLHDLGECEVKHGETVSLVSLHGDGVGNVELPTKLKSRSHDWRSASSARTRRVRIAIFGSVLLALVLSCIIFFRLEARSRMIAQTQPTNPPADAPEKSIAVLPFENMSANPETGYFTDGVQDEILSNLAKVADLKVISRTSVMQYKTVRSRNLREIGRQLGVAHILEGSVQRSGDRVRINAQLIDARTDAHLWAQSYDRDLADVFAIQTEIAQTIADQLRAKISPREQAALAEPPTTDLVAEKLYSQARESAFAGSNPDAKQSLLQAIALLDEAVARDPRFLRAYGLLVVLHLDLYWQGFDHTPARRALAAATIERAAQVQPDADEVHLARADYAYQGFRDYDRARSELKLAQKTSANNSYLFTLTGSIARRQGRWEETIENQKRALEIDPLNFRFMVEAAFTFQIQRRYVEAKQMWQRALAILPNDSFARTQLAQIAFDERGDAEPLRLELNKTLDQDPTAATEIANELFEYGLARHDSAVVTRALQAIRPEGLRDLMNNSLWTRDWFVGLAAHVFGDAAAAQKAFSAARVIEEKNVQAEPEYAPAWSRLALIDAALGHKEDAIREGRRACELLPLTQDALDGPAQMINLAKVYAWTGERVAAFEELDALTRIPSGITYGDLKLNPQWNALRGDPRFDRIVASLLAKEVKL